jgi:Zn-dependent protease with chaperone function
MIEGYFYEQGSAARIRAVFSSNDLGRYAVELENGRVHRGELSHLQVSERLGNVERKITLDDGSLFTTRDNDSVDALFKESYKVNSFIHYLETNLKWIAVAIIITAMSAFSFFKWGVPWASEKIAHALPYKTNELISSGSMDFLDKYMLDESELSEEVQRRIRTHFEKNLAILSVEEESQIEYTLHFRSWTMEGEEIPNALALPAGDIILTDKFVTLAESQDEIDAVLLHEMGHVVHRHSLEMLIQGTFITVAVMLLTGDGTALGDMGIGLGSALVTSAYSRGHESEADVYAFEKMLKVGIDPKSFSNIMQRMEAYLSSDNTMLSEDEAKILDYFSSHPETKERIEIANRYSQCFNEGLTVCK